MARIEDKGILGLVATAEQAVISEDPIAISVALVGLAGSIASSLSRIANSLAEPKIEMSSEQPLQVMVMPPEEAAPRDQLTTIFGENHPQWDLYKRWQTCDAESRDDSFSKQEMHIIRALMDNPSIDFIEANKYFAGEK